MSDRDFDLLVLGGGGSAGFTAATTAMKTGARVGMVEAVRLGGLCILAGCMPSKTLLHEAAQRRAAGRANPAGHAEVLARKREVVGYLAGSRERAVAAKQQKGLEVIMGRAAFVDPHAVEVDGRRITADKFMVATGSNEIIPPVEGLAETGFITSGDFLDLGSLPGSLVVLGGGAIALELAQYAVRMGVQTTLVQRSDHVLSKEDPRVGQLIAEALAEEGLRVLTGTKLIRVVSEGGAKQVVLEHAGAEVSVSAEEILVALGRRPHSQGLNLEAAGVATERGAVRVNRYMQTSAEHIFAGGDVTGVSMIVNLAIVQGKTAGYNATHAQMREVDDAVVPRAVFTDPQFARVGLNAAEAAAAGIACVEAEFNLGSMGVARTYPEPIRGFITMRAAVDDGRLVGAELVAPEASLMIHDVAVAMRLGAGPGAIADVPYIHPCLAEATNFCAERLVRKLGR